MTEAVVAYWLESQTCNPVAGSSLLAGNVGGESDWRKSSLFHSHYPILWGAVEQGT